MKMKIGKSFQCCHSFGIASKTINTERIYAHDGNFWGFHHSNDGKNYYFKNGQYTVANDNVIFPGDTEELTFNFEKGILAVKVNDEDYGIYEMNFPKNRELVPFIELVHEGDEAEIL